MGDWLQLETLGKSQINNDGFSIAASYRFSSGKHHRSIEVSPCGKFWKIIDSLSSFKNECLIRWRLAPLNWEIDRFDLGSSLANLKVKSNKNIVQMKLVSGYESLFMVKKKVSYS